MLLSKGESQEVVVKRVKNLEDWRAKSIAIEGRLSSEEIRSNEWNFVIGKDGELFNRLNEFGTKLADVSSIFVGLQTSADSVFLFKNTMKEESRTISVLSKELGAEVEIETSLLKSVVRSGKIGRYWATPTACVLFPYNIVNGKAELIQHKEFTQQYPRSWEYIQANKKLLIEREHGKFRDTGWYQLYPKNLEMWESPKIMIPYMITRLAAYYDTDNLYFVNVTTGGFGLRSISNSVTMKYLTGLLNSKLLDWFLKHVSTNFQGGYFAANKQFLDQLPIRTIDPADPADVARHDRMVALVEKMLDLNKRLAAAKAPHEKEVLAGMIDATDRQIDRLVYELYGLAEDEVAIVEGVV